MTTKGTQFSLFFCQLTWLLHDVATLVITAFSSLSCLMVFNSNIESTRKKCTNLRLGSTNLRFGLANHYETSFYEHGAFHESFILKPPALALDRVESGSDYGSFGLSVTDANVSHRTFPHQTAVLPSGVLSKLVMPADTARAILYVVARVSSILTMRCVRAVWMPS